MKSEDKRATLCGHKAVALLGSHAMKQQPFSIYYEKLEIQANSPEQLRCFLTNP